MVDKRENTIYYVSNLGTGMVSIIDGDSYRIIKEVEIGPRPQNIIVDDKNNVYIASDRNSTVTLIHDLYDLNKTWHMPNNGNIQVDSFAQRIYVCNTEEVCIYSLRTGEKIGCITGFIAAASLELDKNREKLVVLDILKNELKVYSTSDFHLIKLYKNVGTAPSCFLIGEDEKHAYIANKGVTKGSNKYNISILNLEDGNSSYIDLQKGSIITALEKSELFLYAANSGLHRIEVIDLLKGERTAIIKTTLPELQRLRLSPDKKILLATSRSNDGKGVLDRIDTYSNVILDTFTFQRNNSIPYDIGIVTQRKLQIDEESFIFTSSEDKWKQKNGTIILAKKILSTYQEKMIFSEVLTKLPLKLENISSIEEIIFKKCEIIDETKNRKIIDARKEYSMLQYDFYIPYYIEYKDQQEQKSVIEGRLEGKQKATLYIPAYAEQQGVQFVVNSFTMLTNAPVIIDKNLKFDVSTLISTKVIVDEMVFIPLCKNCEVCQKRGEIKE
ncbi:YncE family protein [Clostridiaceae bacterium UIB06]|uniref:YncE family protein n=1 Tax=Clostridium thailandense TaxID=2794346 RepID=A0A949TUU2_9CLOT|nr:YncE family protein [Clostridium thailandense]MBV7272813.1 YncE family protein [Clostridium thailandense]MCH5137646.1 YncE family protein [Clostridiaceae bacterium UIB06]